MIFAKKVSSIANPFAKPKEDNKDIKAKKHPFIAMLLQAKVLAFVSSSQTLLMLLLAAIPPCLLPSSIFCSATV